MATFASWGRGRRIRFLALMAALTVCLQIPGATTAASKNACGANTGTDVYVNPVAHRTKGVTPTGINSPSECAFASITDAIASADARGLGAGARIILTGATSTDPAVFSAEVFPLTLPDGMLITTTDDPALGGAGLDPTRYVIGFTGKAAYALYLAGGGLRGLTLTNERAARATMMVVCDAGTAEMDSVVLDGKSPSGGEVRRGLHLWSGCLMTLNGSADSGVSIHGASGDGIVVDQGAEITMHFGEVHNNGADGLVVRGRASLERVQVYLNSDDGILVDHSESAVFDGLMVHANGSNGFEIHQANVTLRGNRVYNNSRPLGWDQPQLLFVGPSDPYGVPFDTGLGTVLAYRFGADSCSAADASSVLNQIFAYDLAAGSSEGSVGVYATDGAIVAADGNTWRSANPSENVNQDAYSLVDADAICGILIADPGPEGPLGP